MRGRRARVQVVYEGKDVSADLAPFLLDCTYNDNEPGKADDVSLTFDDRDGRFLNDWWMEKGEQVQVAIICEDDWLPADLLPSLSGASLRLNCGVFTVDQMEPSGPPDRVAVKGVAAPLNKPLRRQKKSKAWESLTLRAVATEIASRNDMALVWEGDGNPVLNREDQRDESDLAFLYRLCAKYGQSVKLHDKQIVIFSEARYEAAPALDSITRGEDRIISYRFRYQAGQGAKKASTNFFDVIAGMPITGSATDEQLVSLPPEDLMSVPDVIPNEIVAPELVMTGVGLPPEQVMTVEQELVIDEPVSSIAEADEVSKEKLRSNNKRGWYCSLSLFGDPRVATGLNIRIKGWGKFDGKWKVEKCSHKVGAAYGTTLELYRARL